MIRWRRIEAGRYESEDKRFEIRRVYNTVPYPDTWLLIDNDSANSRKYYRYTRLACQIKAEDLKAEGRRIDNGQKAKQENDTTRWE